MSIALNNLIMPAVSAAPSGEVSSKPKCSASDQADKTTNPEAKPAQAKKSAGKTSNSQDAPDTTQKSNAHSGPKAPGGKTAKVKKGEKVVVTAVSGPRVFSEIIQSAKASGNPPKVAVGESAAEVLTKKDIGNPDIVLAGKANAVKGDADSLQVRASILSKTQVVPAANKPVPEGQASATSEVGDKLTGEMLLNAEKVALPFSTPVKVEEALADAVSPDAVAEKAGKSHQAGLEATGENQQVLSSPAGPVLPALAEGMKQISEAIRTPAPATGNKSTPITSASGRKVVSTEGLTSNVSDESVEKMETGVKIDALLRSLGDPVVTVGQNQAGRGQTQQEVLEHLGAATEPVRFNPTDTPTVSPGNSSPSPVVNQVVEALRASAARQGNQVVIQLNPPELGKVSIRLNVTGDEVRGVLRVDNPQTLTQLQREAPALLSRLAEAGVQLKQMDLSLSQQGAGDSSLYSQLRDESDLWSQDGQDHNSQVSASELLPDEHVLAGTEETSRGMTMLTDDAINVWI